MNVVFKTAFFLFVSFSINAEVLIDGDEVDLTTDDMDRTIRILPEEVKDGVLKDPERLKTMLLSTYMTKVAASRAEKKELDKTADVVDRLWNRKINFLAVAEINDIVNSSGSSDFEIAAKEKYLANPEQFLTKKKVEASHILIGIKSRTFVDAEAVAKEIFDKLNNSELEFEQAAKEYSDDKGSAERGGALGVFEKGMMVPPFEDAAFGIEKEGAIVGPIKTNFGYHIIRLDKKYPQTLIPFEEVKAGIVDNLQKAHRASVREEYLLKIQNDAKDRMKDQEIDKYINSVLVQEENKD